MNVLAVLLVIYIALGSIEAKGYKYDSSVVYDFLSYQDFANEMMIYDESTDSTVPKYAIALGVYSRYCKHIVDSPAFRGLERFAGSAVKIATVPAEGGFIYQMDECAELFYYSKGQAMPYGRTTNFDYLALKIFVQRMRSAKFNITNHFDYPVEVFSADEDAGTVSQGVLQVNETNEFSTLYGTLFMACTVRIESRGISRQEIVTDGVLDFFLQEEAEHVLHPRNRLHMCQSINEDDPSAFAGRSLAPPTATNTVMENGGGGEDCASLDERWKVFFIEIAYRMRAIQNFLQPQIVRPVTETGFELRRMPAETFAWLKEFFYESGAGVRNITNGVNTVSRKKADLLTEEDRKGVGILTEESMAGTCLNQLDVPTEIKNLPMDLKKKLVSEVSDVFLEWYGGQLIGTSIYGVRRYFSGSILRMHVDTITTHVVSAIINIGQQVDEEWPLVIHIHNGQEHSLVMEPGDLLLYESAKLPHGRPSVLKGDYYDNLFIHFMPVIGWEGMYTWF